MGGHCNSRILKLMFLWPKWAIIRHFGILKPNLLEFVHLFLHEKVEGGGWEMGGGWVLHGGDVYETIYCTAGRYSDTSAPLPPRPLVTSAPSHLGPTTISAPV